MNPEIVYLAATGARVTGDHVEIGGRRLATRDIARCWSEARRPGLLEGGVSIVAGALVLARGALVFKAVGALLVLFGFVRARAVRHVVRLALRDQTIVDGLQTGDARLASRIVDAVDRARRRARDAAV